MFTWAVPIFTFTGSAIRAIRSFCRRPPACFTRAVRSMSLTANSFAVPATLMTACLTTFWSKEWATQSSTSPALSSRESEFGSMTRFSWASSASTVMFFARTVPIRSICTPFAPSFLPLMSRLKPVASMSPTLAASLSTRLANARPAGATALPWLQDSTPFVSVALSST